MFFVPKLPDLFCRLAYSEVSCMEVVKVVLVRRNHREDIHEVGSNGGISISPSAQTREYDGVHGRHESPS